jgi:hypothetical protein
MDMNQQTTPAIKSEHYYTAAEGAFGTADQGALLDQFKPLARVTHCVLLLEDGTPLVGLHITPPEQFFDGEHAMKESRANALSAL